MQTKQQIRQLLTSAGVNPNKRLGQNFLIDLNLIRLLIKSANITKNDIVLEVGCGTGSLTEDLTKQAGTVIAVEIDAALARVTEKQLIKNKNTKIINADILKNKSTINPAVTSAIKSARKNNIGRLLLVANLPYNVASSVILNLITGPIHADAMYVTVQKEVALRMTAVPNNKNYSILSIFLAAIGDVKLLRTLKPSVFWPAPQVNSAMISFARRKEKLKHIKDMNLFSEVVNLFMQHRRKMLKTCAKLAKDNLAKIENWPEIFEKCSINPNSRPDQIPPPDYIAIANLCSKYRTQQIGKNCERKCNE